MLPEHLHQTVRDLVRAGVSTKVIAAVFTLPSEWVKDFVRRDTGETPTQ